MKNRKTARLHPSVFFCTTAFHLQITYAEKKKCVASQMNLFIIFFVSWFILLDIFSLFPSLSHSSLTHIHRNHLRIELKSLPQTVVQLINHLPASFHGDRAICRVRQRVRDGGSETSISSVIKEKWKIKVWSAGRNIVCEAGNNRNNKGGL